jgi:azurin
MLKTSTLLLATLLAVRVSAAEPQIIKIKTLQAQMRYDLTEFTVTPGTDVKIILENVDDMPHNLVLFEVGTDVVAVTNKNMEKPEEALKRDWLPDDKRMLAHSKMVNPKTTDEIVFKAPTKPGIYPYVCSFPGHALSMQGKMKVAAPGPGLTALKFAVYLGDWKQLPDFSKLQSHREGEIPDNLVQLKFDDYKNQYGVVFTGKLKAPKDSEYTFLLTSDDGGRILIDGKQVVEHDGIHPASDIKEGKVKLKAGEHDFRLEYFQQASNAEIFAAWRGADFMTTPLSKWTPPNLKEFAVKKKADVAPPIPLVVEKEPVIYRNFITGAGNRGLGVGYPGGINVAWNAEQMNLALVWRGAFIDAGRHWTGRGGGAQAPLGFDVFRPAGELCRPFAVLNSTSEEWPTASPGERPTDLTWKGYTLDAKRFPTFLYEWNNVKVTDRFDVEGDAVAGAGKLIRTVKLTGNIPPNAYFRAATGANIQPADGGYLVNNGRFTLDGRECENTFRIAADGAQVAGQNLLIPARAEIKITYSWPTTHAHHAH